MKPIKPILFDFPMPIKTERLILRSPQIGDGAMLNEAILESFDVLRQWMPWAKEKMSIADSEEFVRRSSANWILKNNQEPYLPIFIFDRKTGRFLGGTGYHHFDWEIPYIEIGYWLRDSCVGYGYMTEAVGAITQYAFRQLHMKRVVIKCDVDNVRSKKVPERLGYQLESVMKFNRTNAAGALSDTAVFVRYNLEGLPSLKVEW